MFTIHLCPSPRTNDETDTENEIHKITPKDGASFGVSVALKTGLNVKINGDGSLSNKGKISQIIVHYYIEYPNAKFVAEVKRESKGNDFVTLFYNATLQNFYLSNKDTTVEFLDGGS